MLRCVSLSFRSESGLVLNRPLTRTLCISSLSPDLNAGEDAGNGPERKQEAGDGAQLARVSVTEVGDDLVNRAWYLYKMVAQNMLRTIRSFRIKISDL